jgi:hypothetical protein
MAMYYKIGAMLVLLFLYSSQSISATANNVKCNGCVGSKDLKNNAVTGSKIKKNAVTGSKIKAGAVTGDKIKDGSVSVEDLSLELQGDISALGTDIDSLETQPKAIFGVDVPDNNQDSSNGHPIGTIYIQNGTNDVFISRDDTIAAAIWEQLTPKKYAIGDVGPAGGWVYGVTADGLHGREAAPVDQSSGAGTGWGCVGTDIPGAGGRRIGTGARNTVHILAGCTTIDIAADLADAYRINGYGDWYLPSVDELNIMYLSIGQGAGPGAVGGFSDTGYWSSTEVDGDFAWVYRNDLGAPTKRFRGNGGLAQVRAVRTF